MTNVGVVALACVRCENGCWVLHLSHRRAEPMSKEQLDAVRDQLLAEQDNDLRQTFLSAYLEDAEKGAGMIISYAAEKGLKLDESPKEVIEYIGSIDSEDIDVEMTPELLALVSGGQLRDKREKMVDGYGYDEEGVWNPIIPGQPWSPH